MKTKFSEVAKRFAKRAKFRESHINYTDKTEGKFFGDTFCMFFKDTASIEIANDNSFTLIASEMTQPIADRFNAFVYRMNATGYITRGEAGKWVIQYASGKIPWTGEERFSGIVLEPQGLKLEGDALINIF